MWWQNNFIYLNNGSMFKDLFFKHGGEGFKSFHLYLKLVGLIPNIG
jgi:hypothetical protein